MKRLILVGFLLLSGCAMAVERDVTYSVRCKNCKTPYGKGDLVEMTIHKELKVSR